MSIWLFLLTIHKHVQLQSGNIYSNDAITATANAHFRFSGNNNKFVLSAVTEFMSQHDQSSCTTTCDFVEHRELRLLFHVWKSARLSSSGLTGSLLLCAERRSWQDLGFSNAGILQTCVPQSLLSMDSLQHRTREFRADKSYSVHTHTIVQANARYSAETGTAEWKTQISSIFLFLEVYSLASVYRAQLAAT